MLFVAAEHDTYLDVSHNTDNHAHKVNIQFNPIQCVLMGGGSPLCPHRTITYKLVYFQLQLSRR